MAFDTGKRNARSNSTDILIVGSGFAGLGMAIKLLESGRDDFLILERGDAVAGTWRDNHYPGCACDVQSHLYSFSFEPNPEWTRMFAPQPEIRRYLQHCAEKYGVVPYIRFGETLSSARWDADAQRWEVETASGARYRARVLISGMGGLSNPAIPDIPGSEDFAGERFHSATWRHDVDLRGKRVAVVGTGASAIQFVPQIVPQVEQLDLYQRSAAWILPKPDRAIGAAERALYRRIPAVQQMHRALLYARLESRAVGFVLAPRLLKTAELLAGAHRFRQVRDADLRAKLTPDYAIGCKRILMSDDYYPALTQSHVDVVTDGIERIVADGVITRDGTHRPADVLIYGTGFQAQDPIPRGTIFGRDGRDITDGWETHGPQAYNGTVMAGFPNLFFIVGPNTGLGHNSMVYMIESQVAYILNILDTMQRKGLAEAEPRQAAQDRFVAWIDRQHTRDTPWSSGCSSWYLHPSGRNTALWPSFTFLYRNRVRRMQIEDFVTAPTAQTATAEPTP